MFPYAFIIINFPLVPILECLQANDNTSDINSNNESNTDNNNNNNNDDDGSTDVSSNNTDTNNKDAATLH